mmetsp:Transcript_11806/g.36406  ORF Transcript_11806/g.36406 Transcript_11806/m.36406 type:complete len:224 (-) Transcript_11806:117-788(-)
MPAPTALAAAASLRFFVQTPRRSAPPFRTPRLSPQTSSRSASSPGGASAPPTAARHSLSQWSSSSGHRSGSATLHSPPLALAASSHVGSTSPRNSWYVAPDARDDGGWSAPCRRQNASTVLTAWSFSDSHAAARDAPRSAGRWPRPQNVQVDANACSASVPSVATGSALSEAASLSAPPDGARRIEFAGPRRRRCIFAWSGVWRRPSDCCFPLLRASLSALEF